MSRLFSRRPSAPLLVSVLALVLAASGSAVAATRLTSGDKLIKKGSLSGNRLRRRTIAASEIKKATITATQIKKKSLTGSQINLAKLGTVPRAAAATNATELGGQPASYYEQATGRTGTKGIISVNGTAAGTAVQLFQVGPFSVSMTCGRNAAGQVSLTLTGDSTIAGSDLNGNLNVGAGAVTDLGPDVDIAATTAAQTANDVTMDFEAPGGEQAIVSGATGVNSLGADCWANFAGIA
jgi:hypothetical protein